MRTSVDRFVFCILKLLCIIARATFHFNFLFPISSSGGGFGPSWVEGSLLRT